MRWKGALLGLLVGRDGLSKSRCAASHVVCESASVSSSLRLGPSAGAVVAGTWARLGGRSGARPQRRNSRRLVARRCDVAISRARGTERGGFVVGIQMPRSHCSRRGGVWWHRRFTRTLARRSEGGARFSDSLGSMKSLVLSTAPAIVSRGRERTSARGMARDGGGERWKEEAREAAGQRWQGGRARECSRGAVSPQAVRTEGAGKAAAGAICCRSRSPRRLAPRRRARSERSPWLGHDVLRIPSSASLYTHVCVC